MAVFRRNSLTELHVPLFDGIQNAGKRFRYDDILGVRMTMAMPGRVAMVMARTGQHIER